MAADPQPRRLQRSELQHRLQLAVQRCANDGVGALFHLTGEAGIGKTTLAQAMIGEAVALGVQVVVAESIEIQRTSPFAAVRSAMTFDGASLFASLDVASRPVSVLQQPSRLLPHDQRYAMVEAITEVVEALCRKPTVLIIEDIHWADPASIEAMAAIARMTITYPLVVLLTARSGYTSPALLSLDRELRLSQVENLPVGPLDGAEIDALVRELCGGEPSAGLSSRAQGAAGNPFLVEQLVNGLLAEGGLIERDQQLHPRDDDIPLQMRAAVDHALSQLGEQVTTLVRAGSVYGASVSIRDLAELLGSNPVELAPAVGAAVNAGLLAEDAQLLSFRHDLIRSAVYQQMPSSVRMASHAAIANILSNQAAPRSLVATHLLLSGGADEQTIERLQQAAADTAPIAPDSAIEFLDRALDLVNDLTTRVVIQLARLEVLTFLGRLVEAEDVARWLLETAPQEEHSVLWSRLGGISTIAGDTERAIEYLDKARALAIDDYERCPMVALSAVASVANGSYLDAISFAEEAIKLGEQTGHAVGQSVGAGLMGRILTFAHAPDKGLEMGAKAIAIADRDPSGDAHWYLPCLHYGMTGFDLDRMEIANAMAARGFEIADALPILWSRPLYGTFAAAIHFRRGELDRCAAEAETAVELAERMTSRQTLSWAQSLLAMVAAEFGDIDDAVAWAESASLSWRAGHNSLGFEWFALGQARVQRALGNEHAAFKILDDEWDRFENQLLTLCHPIIAVDLATLSLQLDQPATFDKVSVGIQAASAQNSVPSVQAKARWIRALGESDQAGARHAIDRLRQGEHRLELATWLAFDPELVSRDRSASDTLREALALFDSMGAARSAASVRAQLEALGETAPRENRGWDSLTPTESEIMRLLAQGCTNAQIAQQRSSSRRTIESHLSRVYQKLNIEGRVKLTVAASDHFRAKP